MAKIYAKLIADGKMDIADVPARWRAETEALLAKEEA